MTKLHDTTAFNLGPLLFIIHMNDMALELSAFELDMYTDNSNVGTTSTALDIHSEKIL